MLMVASIPARQRSARRNQRCFCCSARFAESRPRAGSAIRTSLPNSLGLCAFPLRMTSVWVSNRLNTLPSALLSPPITRCLVWLITFSTKGKK